MMEIGQIYQPIEKELKEVEELLETSLTGAKNQSILKINRFLLKSRGKRLRPALVILSAKAVPSHRPSTVGKPSTIGPQLIKIAGAIELIHMASLIHDDVIDRAGMRHNRQTVNLKWGQDVSITLGDYLFSIAFELVSDYGNSDIIRCISSATKAMCEGEFLQVCERDNLDLLKERYIFLVRKKTAALFAASCQAGTLISNPQPFLLNALKEYGLNFGVAFQITDDYLDIVCEEKELGKTPGQDIKVGELTLPLLNLFESVPDVERKELKKLLSSKERKESLQKIKSKLINSGAALKTKASTFSYIAAAKNRINILPGSQYKESLLNLADFVIEERFDRSSYANKA